MTLRWKVSTQQAHLLVTSPNFFHVELEARTFGHLLSADPKLQELGAVVGIQGTHGLANLPGHLLSWGTEIPQGDQASTRVTVHSILQVNIDLSNSGMCAFLLQEQMFRDLLVAVQHVCLK